MKALSTGLLTIVALLLLGCGGLVGRSKREQAAAEARRTEHAAMLKSYVPPDVLKSVDPDFYTYRGFRDWWRIPLVYPFSVRCIDTLDGGRLCRHDGKTGMAHASAESDVNLARLVAFQFDARFLVGRTDGGEWVVFEFATGRADVFRNQAEWDAAARAKGYSGGLDLASVEAQFNRCFD